MKDQIKIGTKLYAYGGFTGWGRSPEKYVAESHKKLHDFAKTEVNTRV